VLVLVFIALVLVCVWEFTPVGIGSEIARPGRERDCAVLADSVEEADDTPEDMEDTLLIVDAEGTRGAGRA
jgi:hypothetical protein